VDIRIVDSVATRGTTPLHRIAPVAKLVAFALVLSAVVVSTNLLVVIGVALALLGVIAALRLPARPMLVLAAYPGLFAALFAFAASAGVLAGALVVAKAVTAALSAVLLMFTTPYPQVFAPLQRVMPAVLGDALLMTYRSLFLLLERFGHVLTAARLRAGLVGVHPVQSARTVTRTLGGVLLYSIDLSHRTYDVMHLRGYDGRLVVSVQADAPVASSAVLLVGAAAIAATAIVWRIGAAGLAPFAWLPLLGGAVALLGGLLVRALTPKNAS
jgi:energy-coupling factor transporter transmembrane protein EcfT